jgi:hypothetical protein
MPPQAPAQRFRFDWVLNQQLAVGPAPRAERHLQRLQQGLAARAAALAAAAGVPLALRRRRRR